jgi:formyl-CoA transferase
MPPAWWPDPWRPTPRWWPIPTWPAGTLVELPRTDGVDQPVLIPGLPVKFAEVAEGPESRVPWLGEHTDAVLAAELGLGPEELARLRADGVIA